MPASRSTHPTARKRAGHPPRQRHTQAHAHRQRVQPRAAVSSRRWSASVNERSDAMDVEKDIFKTGSASEIAQSLKRSSERSRRRKGTPFQSAMSMLNFYINRAGRNLPKTRRATLQQAKKELRSAFRR
ncbi:DUF3175 domain-containing protein [Paraburkholderia phosphatilytica]|uniref:DUF3175 domain-containing protein n=1 Tax=Paraburkholderia phosphatilytica TaxID=2282883 RepID=UPI000E4F3B72|nr:DUF3175 domain-containing protein [Paraburkholderia phosphatilytica]